MEKLIISINFKIKEEVIRKADPDKLLHIVIAIVVDCQGIMYQVRGDNGIYTLYEFEIARYSERLGILN
ncbi:MAG: hypothetical protein RIQ59_548 [Bacteroidota bacterium]|jgi:hypothetical protein